MYDLIVLGGGPAGLAATIYALRKRLNVLLITHDLGGKANDHLQIPEIEHHLVIDGEEIINRFANEIERQGPARSLDEVETVTSEADGYRVQTRGGKTHTTRALVIATGAHPRRLNVPGERDFLMRGLSYSVLRYAPLFVNRKTAVIGDTPLAFRSAMELAQIANQVTLIMPAPRESNGPLRRRLQLASNVILMDGYTVERIEGDQYARRLTVRKGSEVREVQADAFFVTFDLVPNSSMVARLVECDANGRIKIDAHNRTSAPGIFAAGDVTNADAEHELIALGEGAKAALAAYEYVLEHPVQEMSREPLEAGEWR